MSKEQKVDQVVAWQRLEGLLILITSLVLYTDQTTVIWPFFAAILVPDISMVGYLINTRIGAFVYNLGHSLVFPLLLLLLTVPLDNIWLLYIATVWMGHIGIDRLMGFGLKYNDSFRHTHLGIIGVGKK